MCLRVKLGHRLPAHLVHLAWFWVDLGHRHLRQRHWQVWTIRASEKTPHGGTHGCGPFQGLDFYLPPCVLGGVHEFGSCSETGKPVVSRLKKGTNRAEMRPEPGNTWLKGPSSAPGRKTGVGGLQEIRTPRREIVHFPLQGSARRAPWRDGRPMGGEPGRSTDCSSTSFTSPRLRRWVCLPTPTVSVNEPDARHNPL